MISAYYQEKWQQVRTSASPDECKDLAEEVALAFLDRHYFNDEFESDYVRLLCEMSTAFPSSELNRIGASALFGIVVEGLCDNFEELQTAAYNHLMSFIIDFCANLPAGGSLKEGMARFGIHGFEDLYRRVERLRKTSSNYRDLPADPKVIIVLSRVTIGADVAVTSVLIQRLCRTFPQAQLVVIGGNKMNSLYRAHPRVRFQNVDYSRQGGLLERLWSWFLVLEAIEKASSGLAPDEVLLADPDSRLSQLGVLPLCDDQSYLFFSSRSSQNFLQHLSISELVNYWYNQLTGENDTCYPALWLDRMLQQQAKAAVDRMRKQGARRVVAVNFGVGGNSRKRVDNQFEREMILELLAQPGTLLLLDQGFGADEIKCSKDLLQAAAGNGYRVAERRFEDLEQVPAGTVLIGVEAGIDQVAALIKQSDEFIGYDSACQHIAAAQEVPTYTIFAGSNNVRFVRRWCPNGLGRREIIHVDTLTQPPIYNRKTILLRLMHARNKS